MTAAEVREACGEPDTLSRALMHAQPGLAGHVHYVDGRPWCDGINHTTMCDPAKVSP